MPRETAVTRFAPDQLRSFCERIERLSEEKKALSDDIRDIYAEAKSNGFDVKALREIVRRRKQDKDERAEQDAILETYMHALGMLFDTPLGKAATGRATAAARPTGPQTAAALAQAMADDGLISQEAAAESARIAAAVDKLEERTIAKIAADPKVRAAVKKLGTPVELTEEEKAKGYSSAFISKDGTRMAIGAGVSKACDFASDAVVRTTLPAPAKGDDRGQSTTGGPNLERPSMAAQQPGEPAAGVTESRSASLLQSPYLLAPPDPDGVEGASGDDRAHCPAILSIASLSSQDGEAGDATPRPVDHEPPGAATPNDPDLPSFLRIGDPQNEWLRKPPVTPPQATGPP